MGCPICARNWYAVKKAAGVCEKHQEWIVTHCEHCGRDCFSDHARECPNCWTESIRMYQGSRDPRGYLKWIGQEGSRRGDANS